jgi:hypothetical protein
VSTPRSWQLRELVRLLDEAAAAQPLADEVVAACGEPSEVPLRLVRAGARLQILFYQLRGRLDELELDQDLEEQRDQARRLLLYHQWMLREALKVACSVRPADSNALRINGLGAPADKLRELRGEILALVDLQVSTVTGRARRTAR